MLPYGGDRVRSAGGKVILHSAISKGWVPRRARTNVHAEYPGTAVLWDEQYFEVVSAELLPRGGIRYVLELWRDDHVIRVFDSYDEATEARRLDDFRAAAAQRKKSVGARFAGVIFGHFPAHVQEHLQNELGVMPARMTILSCIPSVLLLGACAYLTASATLAEVPSPVPVWLMFIAGPLVSESGIRFLVAMQQNRGMGSLLGTLAYVLLWYFTPMGRTWPSPFKPGRGYETFTLPPPADVELRDKLELRGAWLTLLTPAEQHGLAERYGFDYRKHAFGLTWLILICSALGVASSIVKVMDSGSVVALSSLVVAGVLAIEQVLRLTTLRHRPAGSFLGVLVRPFMRDLLESR
jgi:hypothetical protein